jgi:hypothetical protein
MRSPYIENDFENELEMNSGMLAAANWRTTSRDLASDSAAALAAVLPSNRTAA